MGRALPVRSFSHRVHRLGVESLDPPPAEAQSAIVDQPAARGRSCAATEKRTFFWFGRNRRLAKDFENLAVTRPPS